MNALSMGSYSNIWDVFLLFSIPVGGGIPAGVLLGQKQGLGWLTMTLIYFVSDIVLALYFEPLLKLVLYLTDKFEITQRLKGAFAQSTQMILQRFGSDPGPFMLIAIAFGVDPMSGRAAAHAMGHGFIAGWAIAIAGDMIFFAVIMASTIGLNDFLGDGKLTVIIIMVLMFTLPSIIQRIRGKHDARL